MVKGCATDAQVISQIAGIKSSQSMRPGVPQLYRDTIHCSCRNILQLTWAQISRN